MNEDIIRETDDQKEEVEEQIKPLGMFEYQRRFGYFYG